MTHAGPTLDADLEAKPVYKSVHSEGKEQAGRPRMMIIAITPAMEATTEPADLTLINKRNFKSQLNQRPIL